MSEKYTDDEWQIVKDSRPLKDLSEEQVMLLHRHWIWANQVREWFQELLAKPGSLDHLKEAPGMALAIPSMVSMYIWYGLLYSLVEACVVPAEGRELKLPGAFGADIAAIQDSLRKCRNAVFHVSRDRYFDGRFVELMNSDESVGRIRRIHWGFARLFFEEIQLRKAAKQPPAAQS